MYTKYIPYCKSTTFNQSFATIDLPRWYTWSSLGFCVIGVLSCVYKPDRIDMMVWTIISITSYTADVVYIGTGGYNNLIDTVFVMFSICYFGYNHINAGSTTLLIGFYWPYYHFVKGQRIRTLCKKKLKHHALWHWGAQILNACVYAVQNTPDVKTYITMLFVGSIVACEVAFNRRPELFICVFATAITVTYPWMSYIS